METYIDILCWILVFIVGTKFIFTVLYVLLTPLEFQVTDEARKEMIERRKKKRPLTSTPAIVAL